MMTRRSLRAVLILLAFATGLLRADDAPTLFGGGDGDVGLAVGDSLLLTLRPSLANASWEFTGAKPVPKPSSAPPDEQSAFEINCGGKRLRGDLQLVGRDKSVDALWEFQAETDIDYEALVVAAEFPLSQLTGGQWTADGASGTFPVHFGKAQLFIGKAASLELAFPSGRKVKFTFPAPMQIVVQDDRQWGGSNFTLRIGLGGGKLAAGQRYGLAMSITTSDGLAYSHDLPDFMKPVTLQAGKDWVPLKVDSLDILPGSALDLSELEFTKGPIKQRIVATRDGHFAGVDLASAENWDIRSLVPRKDRRFYGVNLCFDSSYLSKDEADGLLDRLVRLGYNAVRIHHYEAQLTAPKWTPGAAWDPAQVDKLDYFMAGCTKRGIYITTDLFVSRPISGKQIGLPQYDAPPENRIPPDEYKILILVSDAAFQDWAAFTKKFLDRVNPYTGVRVADDPTVAWISLVNEGPISNNWGSARTMPEFKTAWNKWLAARFTNRDQLAAALGDLAGDEDALQGTVRLPEYLQATTPRGRLTEVFVAATEKAGYERMRDYVRNEIKCQALLTNMNDSGPEVVPLQGVRAEFDYVDEHFYVDHPRFLQKSWQLPSFCSNANPVAAGAPGGTPVATVRIYGKPYTLTEFDYAGPSRFRAVGGPLTGALASLQDWDALWRFDYSATQASLFTPAPMHYFDAVSDPLNQAADRIGLLLFLRGDVSPAPNRIVLDIPHMSLDHPTEKMGASALQAAAWRTRIGGYVAADQEHASSLAEPHGNDITLPVDSGKDESAVTAALAKISPALAESSDPIRSETGEITIARADAVLTIDTPRNAGGFANAGKAIDAKNAGVHIDSVTTDATVFVSSLDSAPIKSSKRLLVTHLTDLQNTGAHFGEGSLQTLEAWGSLPYLVRDGAATVHITLDDPSAYTIWALAPNGQRLEKVDAKVDAGQLVFTANVRGPDGARMLYEISR